MNNIAKYRRNLDMSQQELADKSNITRTYLNKLETGEIDKLSIFLMLDIANALRVTTNDLFPSEN